MLTEEVERLTGMFAAIDVSFDLRRAGVVEKELQ